VSESLYGSNTCSNCHAGFVGYFANWRFYGTVFHQVFGVPWGNFRTYEGVLREIKKPNRDHAHCLLQCLVVAIRPLRIEELAEILVVDFDDEEGIPKLKACWRLEDEEQALLSSCSSLITVVEGDDDSRVVQFSHFSVKEFLTSPRLAAPSRDVSRYYIVLESAHTVMAQACLSVLLWLDDRVEENGDRIRSPLVSYAAAHWVAHAQVQNVSSCIQNIMECLFDPEEPCFTAWLRLHDIDFTFPAFAHYFFMDHSNPTQLPYTISRFVDSKVSWNASSSSIHTL